MSHRGPVPAPPKRGQLASGLGIDGLDSTAASPRSKGTLKSRVPTMLRAGDTVPARVMAARMFAGRRYPRVRMNGRPWCAAA
jgi:hypothetical protein